MDELALGEHDDAIADGVYDAEIVGDEDEGFSFASEIGDARAAFALELFIADTEYFIDEEDVGVCVYGYGEAEAYVHTAGIGHDGVVDEFGDAAEGDDFVEDFIDFAAADAEEAGVEVDIFATGEHGVESGAELEE